MNIVVCGGRDYNDYKTMCNVLNGIKPDLIINGGASGADDLSSMYARAKGVELVVFYANWKKNKSSAGPIRNIKMLDAASWYFKCDTLVSFPGGAGTKHCTELAEKMGCFEIIRVA